MLACSRTRSTREIPDHLPNPCGRAAMSSLPAGKHAGSGAGSKQPAVAEPTLAERARTLVYLGRIGSLSRLLPKQHCFPLGSLIAHGLDGHRHPPFLRTP